MDGQPFLEIFCVVLLAFAIPYTIELSLTKHNLIITDFPPEVVI